MTDSDRALAELSLAEQSLARAEDIVEVLQIRTKARAIESLVHAIEAGYELEQKATIFRLKAERKAGAWLADNVKAGNPQLSNSSRGVKLEDVGISRWQSQRWQSYASLSEARFHGWIDDALAKGSDVSGAGLFKYAQNAHAKDEQRPPSNTLYLFPPPYMCALHGFMVRCQGELQGHHLISKNMARGNDAIRDILRTCPEELMASVCLQHNVQKYADAPRARRILLLQKIYLHGWAHMERVINSLPWKVPMHSLTLEGMLDAD